MGKELPGQERTKGKDRIRNAVRRNLCQTAEEQTEYHHHEKGLNDGPCTAQRGLLVADLYVAPGQKIKQFPIVPQLFETEGGPTRSGADESGFELRIQRKDLGFRIARLRDCAISNLRFKCQ